MEFCVTLPFRVAGLKEWPSELSRLDVQSCLIVRKSLLWEVLKIIHVNSCSIFINPEIVRKPHIFLTVPGGTEMEQWLEIG